MADNSSFITGFASGAFEQALQDIPPWATESTAYKIEGLLKKSLGVNTKMLAQLVKNNASGGSGPGSGNRQGKVNSELDKLIKLLSEQNTAGKKKKKADKDEDEANRNKLFQGKKLNTTLQRQEYMLEAIVKAGAAVLAVDKQYIKTSDELYQSGINVLNGNNSTVSGLEALNQAVILTGLRLETLQEVAQKYSTTVNAVGFNKFAKATGLATARLGEMGYSSKASAELIASSGEALQGFTDIRSRSERDLADDAVNLGGQMARLSLQTGISRKQLQDNLVANSKSTEASLIWASKGEAAAKNVELFSSSFKDPSIGKFFESMASAADPVYAKGFQAMQKAGLGDVASKLAEIGKVAETIGPEEARRRMDEFMSSMNPARIANLRSFISAGTEGASEAADALTALARESRNTSKATDAQTNAAIGTQSTISQLQTEMEKTSATLQAIFFPLESQIKILTGTMKALNDVTYAAAESTNATTRSWVGAGLVVAGFAGVLLGVKRTADTVFSLVRGVGTFASYIAGKGAAIAGKGAEVASKGAEVASKSAAAAGEAGVFGRLAAFMKIGGVAASLALHSGGLNTNEEEELKKRRAMGPTITDTKGQAAGAATNTVKNAEISVPKSPKQSTIDSPSATAADKPSEGKPTGPTAEKPGVPVSPGIEKPVGGADINSMMATQTSVLQQILQGTTNLISINKDILRYARIQ